MTTTTMFDGLLDDDEPQEVTTRELVDRAAEAQAEPATDAASANLDSEVATTTAPANPDDEEPMPATPAVDAAEKLVLVEGQRFIVDAGVDNEAVRHHLIRQGFAQLAGAELRVGTAQHDGRTLATVEFIKKAGTKG